MADSGASSKDLGAAPLVEGTMALEVFVFFGVIESGKLEDTRTLGESFTVENAVTAVESKGTKKIRDFMSKMSVTLKIF
jgi:hypothetical protein